MAPLFSFSRRSLPVLKNGTYFSDTATEAPVRGLRPMRGARCLTVKAPKLRKAMTVEAWVYPTRKGGSLALRETKRGAAWSLYAGEAGIGSKLARGKAPKLRTWTHLAMTYDGATVRRFVDGRLDGTQAATGAIAGGSYPLRFDTNSKIASQLLGIMQDGLGIDYVDKRNALIEAVTLQDVKRVAARILRTENLITTVVGQPKNL